MKKIAVICMAVAAMLTTSFTAGAQFKNLVKKAKKGIEKVVETATDKTQGANPLADLVDIELVAAKGDTVSANYGSVTLVIKVKAKTNQPQIRFGSVNNAPMMAVSADGTVYKPELNLNGVYPKDVVEGAYVTIPLDDSDMIFENVKLGTPMFSVVKFGVMVDAAHKGMVTFDNVPIHWGEPTE